MIIEEYDYSLFEQRFENMERVGEGKNFSYKGLRALFEYLDDLGTEENPIKCDVIALCCDYTEWEDLEEYAKNYDISEKEEDEDEEDYKTRIEEEINNETTLIKIGENLDEGFITFSH